MEGRIVAITGGASGIGLAVGKLLATRGAKLSIADVQQDLLDQATNAISEHVAAHAKEAAPFTSNDNILISKCDVRDVSQVGAWLKATVDKFGRLDHVANVAGVWRGGKIEDHDEDIWDFVIGVNLTGAMHVLKESSKLLPSHAKSSIVVVASVAGLSGIPGQSAYCASKHGSIGLMRSVAKELGPRGIRVNAVAPGVIHTPMIDFCDETLGVPASEMMAKQLPVGRRAQPEEVAGVVAFLLGEESSYVTGSVYTVDEDSRVVKAHWPVVFMLYVSIIDGMNIECSSGLGFRYVHFDSPPLLPIAEIRERHVSKMFQDVCFQLSMFVSYMYMYLLDHAEIGDDVIVGIYRPSKIHDCGLFEKDQRLHMRQDTLDFLGSRCLQSCAAAEGLLLQPISPKDRTPDSSAVRLAYGSSQIAPTAEKVEDESKGRSIEAHGVVGLLDLVTTKYLISITQREHVAQIRGKSVYSIKDVTLIPLSSQADAEEAILSAGRALKQGSKAAVDSEESDIEDDADTGSVNDETPDQAAEALQAPSNSALKKSTSFAKDVVQDRGKYGRFAERWFSKGGWAASGRKRQGISEEAKLTPEQAREAEKVLPEDDAASQKEDSTQARSSGDSVEAPNLETSQELPKPKPQANIQNLAPRILRSARLYFSSSNFFFSYDHDLSTSLQATSGSTLPLCKRFDPLFFWNRSLLGPFIDAGHINFALPLLQGFVGQRAFSIAQTAAGEDDAVVDASDIPLQDMAEPKEVQSDTVTKDFLLTLISRRSIKRAGLRYLRRGVDEEGNVANFVETEQILSPKDWDPSKKSYSLVQIRGSIPVFFSQTPYSFKPIPVMFGSEATNHTAFKKHFDNITSRYGSVQAASLVDKSGTEKSIGQAYQDSMEWLNDIGGVNGTKVGFEWFYFHKECGGMRFENVSRLLNTLEGTLRSDSWTIRENDQVTQKQTGVLRTNCMDCLDRTNVTQSSVGGWALQQQLAEEGLSIDLQSDTKTFWFNNLWADNGDAISKQYAGTAALKGDFTRTRKRNWAGALSDFSLTLNRYYNNIFGDYFLQTCIDYYLGHAGPAVFDEFENDMMSQDYALDMRRVRQNAIDTCIKIVLDDPKEDLIGGWTLSCPHEPNTLRSLPFEECVLLLTDVAIYFCRFDWTTEKVGSFERVDLTDITELWRGPYITSVLGPAHTDEEKNVGFALRYKTNGHAMVRTNTRSLQNEHAADDENSQKTNELDKQKTPEKDESRLLAFKALPPKASASRRDSHEEASMSEAELVRFVSGELHGAMAKARRADQLEAEETPRLEDRDVVSVSEARKATGLVESLGYSLKKLVWS
ncbi:hypothetical protein Q7P37_010871 [Cladosporium fusiforme]